MVGEQQQRNSDSQFNILLRSRFFDNIEQLQWALFDPTYNQQYLKLNRKRLWVPMENGYRTIKSFQQICAIYSSREEKIVDAKRAVRIKYSSNQIFQSQQLRKSMWLLLSKTIFRGQQQNYYQILRETDYPEYYLKIIEADVKRTVEGIKNPQLHKRLTNILLCLARRNPYVGYCQGMNFIINFLIGLGFKEEECFWMGIELFEQILPKNYYTNMLGIAIDLKLVEVYLMINKPQVYEKLKELGIALSIFGLEWLVCLGTTILPLNVLVLLWDMLFAEGSSVLIKMVILLIDELTPMLFTCIEFNDFLTNLEPFKKNLCLDQNIFLTKMHSIFLDRSLINFARRMYESLMRVDGKDNKKRNNQRSCNPKWPICHYQLLQNRIEQMDPQPWVFKQQGPPRVIDNYLDLKSKSQKIQRQDNRQQDKKLVVGRMPHTCSPETYDLIQGNRTNIQMSDYDPNTNSYLMPQSSFNQISLRFLQSASFIDSTFVLHMPSK